MSNPQRTGIIQLALVIAFIIVSLAVTRLMQSEYQPAGRNGGGNRDLFVDTAVLNPAPYQIVFETTGTVEARTEISIVPQVSGRVMEVNDAFYSGGAFQRETTLFQIDPRDYELSIRRLLAERARAHTALNLETAEGEAALAEWKQINGGQPVPDLVARIPQLAEAQANLEASEASLANAELALSRTRFTFPFNGRVLTSRIAPGQYVQAGQNYGSAFDLASLEVVASIEGRQLDWLLQSPLTQVRLTADYLGQSHDYEGVLKRSASSLNPTTRFATVRFGFNSPTVDLLPGVFTRIKVLGPQLEGISQVPASALQQNGIIWLVDDDFTLRALQPDIVYANALTLAVSNLPAGSTVVTSRVSGASTGVRVTTESSPTPVASE